MKGILKGIQAMHSKMIIHRDLKPENILLNKNFDIKIADFGMSRKIQVFSRNRYTLNVVSQYYRAPEALLKNQYSFPLDIWAIGCIFYEICTNNVCFFGDSVQ